MNVSQQDDLTIPSTLHGNAKHGPFHWVKQVLLYLLSKCWPIYKIQISPWHLAIKICNKAIIENLTSQKTSRYTTTLWNILHCLAHSGERSRFLRHSIHAECRRTV